MFRSADRFQCLYPISNCRCSCHGNGKGRARATNPLFEKVISWQDTGLENHVWYDPEDNEAMKHPQKCRKSPEKKKNNSTAFDLLLFKLFQWLRADSWATDCCRFYHQKTIHPEGTTIETERNSWITTSIKKLTWGTGYGGKCMCLGKKKTVTWPLLTSWHAGGNWHAWLPEKHYCGLSACYI